MKLYISIDQILIGENMLIPLRDINPSRTFPFVTVLLILINSCVFVFENILSDQHLVSFFQEYGVVPARFFGSDETVLSIPFFQNLLTPLTSVFLHGGWMHLISNMWILWLFGDNVEDRFGHFRFLIFFLIAGFIASATHIFIHPFSTVPTVGASGAVAGVMGAYMLIFPRSKIKVLLFVFILVTTFTLPAWVFIGFWFVGQVFSGLGSLALDVTTGIAFWAHVGGFLAGAVGVLFFRKRRKVY